MRDRTNRETYEEITRKLTKEYGYIRDKASRTHNYGEKRKEE